MNTKKKLKYNKYKGMDNIITIDLHNGYTTIAIISKDENEMYDVQLMLKENTVDTWTLIEKAEHLTFSTTDKTIYSAILKTIDTYLQEGFFDYYIERYEYELKCFDKGNELFEEESLGETKHKVIKSKIAYRTVYYCPICDESLGDDNSETSFYYCPCCKTALDWEGIK